MYKELEDAYAGIDRAKQRKAAQLLKEANERTEAAEAAKKAAYEKLDKARKAKAEAALKRRARLEYFRDPLATESGFNAKYSELRVEILRRDAREADEAAQRYSARRRRDVFSR